MDVPVRRRRAIVVLLVDDQRFVGAAVGQLLAAEPDIELHCCEQATDAVATANRVAPTLILQDLVMPEIDGLALIRHFRANPSTADTPIIALSGNDDAATRARALAEGAAEFVVKLPARADLIACIRHHAAASTPHPDTLDRAVMAVFHDAGAPDFTRRLIDQFIAEAGSQVHALLDADRRGDAAAVKATAHSLRGSSMIMGATRLAALCAEAEAQHGSGGTGTPALMTEIGHELARVRDALALQRPSGAQP